MIIEEYAEVQYPITALAHIVNLVYRTALGKGTTLRKRLPTHNPKQHVCILLTPFGTVANTVPAHVLNLVQCKCLGEGPTLRKRLTGQNLQRNVCKSIKPFGQGQRPNLHR